MARTHILHLMTYKSSGAPGFGIRPVFRTYVVKSQKCTFKTSIFLPYILDLLDTTLQRKLAHIQRFILLNYHLILLQIYLSAPVPWQYATSQYYRSQS